MIIIFQFIPYHFKSEGVSDIARTSLVSWQTTGRYSQISGTSLQTSETDLQTIEIIGDSELKESISRDTIIDIEF
jgi:hypothetical protein